MRLVGEVRCLVPAVEEVVLNVLFELLDVIHRHRGCHLAVEPHATSCGVVAVSVLLHLHLCVNLTLQHTPLILVATMLQGLVE